MKRENYERSLNFLGFVIIKNNLRKGIEKLIEDLHQAEKRVKMSTGDNIDTAISCAIEGKIFKS